VTTIRTCPRCHNLRLRDGDFSRALNGEWRLWCNSCCDRFRALPIVKAEAAFWAGREGRELHAELMASYPARKAAGWATSPMPTSALDRLKASPSSTVAALEAA
jgi:hypothetical protein